MTSYQTNAARNKTNLTANLSVGIILLTSLYLADAILQIFGISIDSFRIAGGILVVTIAMSMISGKLGEDKQNKQEKSGDCDSRKYRGPFSAATDGRSRGDQFYHCMGHAIPQFDASYWVLRSDCAFCIVLLGRFPHCSLVVRLLGQTGINVITRIMGLLLMALGIEFIVTGIKSIFPGYYTEHFIRKNGACGSFFT